MKDTQQKQLNIQNARTHHKTRRQRQLEAMNRRTYDLNNYKRVIERLESSGSLRETDARRLLVCSRKATIAENEIRNLAAKGSRS